MSQNPLRILNLEDSPLDAELNARELKRAGLNFVTARVDTLAALSSALETWAPDIILADYNLPGFDGIEALKVVRTHSTTIPFIFVSGGIGEERAIQALREGATDYVIKDRLSRLPSAVTRALAERAEVERRLATEEQLRASEERFRYASTAALEVIGDWDPTTCKVCFNEAIQTVWGHNLPGYEADFAWWVERIHPDDRDRVVQSIEHAMEASDRWTGEFRFQRGNGTFGHLLERSLIIRDGEGRPYRVISAMLDVTEERRAVDQVRASELRFRSVAESAADAIILSNMEGTIVFWNSGASALFGWNRDEIIGRPADILMPERYRASHRSGMRRVAETGEVRLAGQVLEFEGLHKNGREFPLEMSLTVWTAGGETFCTAVMRDITRRVAQERHQRLQFAVASTLAEATSTADVLSRLLSNIGSNLGLQAGAHWRAEGGSKVQCTGVWSTPEVAGTRFLEMSRNLTLRAGEGLAGQVLAARRPVTLNADELLDPIRFPRAQTAREAGIRNFFALPIIESEKVTAVLEFFDTAYPLEDETFIESLAEVGRRIGEFFERRRSEERLLESEASLAEAQNIAKLGSFSFDVDKGVIEWSEQISRIFNIPLAEFGRTYAEYMKRVHPDDQDRVRRLTTPPFPETAVGFRHRIVCPDGEIRFVHCRLQVMEGTREAPIKVVGTVQDISDQVESEEKIRQLSIQNEMILEYAAEGILGVDRRGKVIFANPAAARITGWSVEELLAAPDLHALIHHSRPNGEPYPREECPMTRCFTLGTPYSGGDLFWRRSGVPFPVQKSCSPMYEGGEVAGCVSIFEDVTEKKLMERQLDQANRVSGLGRVAATIAHEFNNVLMGIQPFAEVIKRRSDDEKILRAATQIGNSVTRGKRVTQEILRFTQPAEPALQPVVLGEWLNQIFPELQSLAGHGVVIALEIPPETIIVRGDPHQLQQVLTNLVLNARDAMSGEGSITVHLQIGGVGYEAPLGPVPADAAVLTVRDTGSGMTPDVLQKIFEPLYTTKRTGTGLGLAVAQQVIQQHAGSMFVSSTPGEGTTFFIVLPSASAAQTTEILKKEMAGANLQRVLLVEDEAAVATGIVLLLEMEGLEVRVVDHAGGALRAIESFSPDAVILDMSLPDMSGTELYEQIAPRYPTLPVLFSSGHGDESSIERYGTKANLAFLRKPYDLASLMEALAKLTAEANRQ